MRSCSPPIVGLGLPNTRVSFFVCFVAGFFVGLVCGSVEERAFLKKRGCEESYTLIEGHCHRFPVFQHCKIAAASHPQSPRITYSATHTSAIRDKHQSHE